MTALSVNINKVATLRNARGGNVPNLLQMTKDIQKFGAQGITIHPRPDQRHIRYEDALALNDVVTTEFNIEGNPIPKFMELVNSIKPTQVTLVPDSVDVLTSNRGWDTIAHKDYLKSIIKKLKIAGIRTSIFVDPDVSMVESAKEIGTDRIELYTETYAKEYLNSPEKAIAPFIKAAEKAVQLNLGINAGHDLSLENINYFSKHIPNLLEVSIGHALVCESLYLGFENVIPMYLQRLKF
ncbi:MAG: pyridoxine 5'-phosphate synthase [Flavobacteriaceae bacterium]|nr:pyridoxine 5'-phosphate synthase [Flavobacteriaceae bacterium]